MALVVVDASGSYRTGSFLFTEGENECNDENVLSEIESLGYDWITVKRDKTSSETKSASDRGGEARDKGSNVQTTESSPSVSDAALKSDDVKKTSFECPSPDCDRTFKNTGARTTHVRTKHPELLEADKQED